MSDDRIMALRDLLIEQVSNEQNVSIATATAIVTKVSRSPFMFEVKAQVWDVAAKDSQSYDPLGNSYYRSARHWEAADLVNDAFGEIG